MGDDKEQQRLLRIADRWLNPKYAMLSTPKLKKRDALALEALGFLINFVKSGYEPRYWYMRISVWGASDEHDRADYVHNLERFKQLQGE